VFALAALAAAPTADAADKPQIVEMVVDYGDGVQLRFTALPWRAKLTVLDALEAAGKHPHGVKFDKRGRGAQAMVTAIGNVKNEGNGKNWLFSVNDKPADVGAGAYELEAGDAVLWEFKTYEYNPK
jgi:hypothetical protein